MGSAESSRHEENLIPRLTAAIYPSVALLAGMQLDLFTPLNEGPMSAEQIAAAIGVRSAKLKPLLYALAAAGLLNEEGERFGNSEVANRFLVRGSPLCMVDTHELLSDLWQATLKTAESIRTGLPQAKYNYSAMSKDELVFINIYDEGQAYTEQEHKAWLEEAGFDDFERAILPDESSIIMARKMRRKRSSLGRFRSSLALSM